ncbi:MAG: double zinc ribbon domain-containing protein [Thermoplasmatota archaeon]
MEAPAARPPKPKGEKGEVRRRKEPRKPFTGQRLKIYVPGRAPAGEPRAGPTASPSPDAGGPPPAETSPKEAESPPRCARCGQTAGTPGALCPSCAAEERVERAAEFVTGIRVKGVEVLEAERFLYQARSALALRAFEDVMQLSERAEERARQLEREHEEAQELVARCEREISTAIERGKDPSLAQRALERAVAALRMGRYLEALEEAANVPSFIGSPASAGGAVRPKPSPRVVAAARECPACGERVPIDAIQCPLCGSVVQEGTTAPPLLCPECGERVEPEWRSCPSCDAPLEGRRRERPRACPSCGKEVLPAWRLCPYCDASLPGDGGGSGRSPRVVSEERVDAPALPPEIREKRLLAEIEEITTMLNDMERRGVDARKGRNLLELAISFTRNRNYDKGERYVRKARHVAETLRGE